MTDSPNTQEELRYSYADMKKAMERAMNAIDHEINRTQITLAQALTESAKLIIPANIQVLVDNTPIEGYRRKLRAANEDAPIPSRLEIITWGVVSTLKQHPALCSRMVGQTTMRQFKNPNIGIAVSTDEDDLVTAVIRNVFAYDFRSFVLAFRESLNEAQEEGYVPTYHCIAISDLSSYGVVSAIPVVIAPATSTLFIGKPYLKEDDQNLFQISLSFDHRLINGAGAASFLKSVNRALRKVSNQTLATTPAAASQPLC